MSIWNKLMATKIRASVKESVQGEMPRLRLDDVHEVYPSSQRVTEEQLDALEREFGAELPRGYRTFLTRFGHGRVNGLLQIYCPDAGQLREQRELPVRNFVEYTRDYTITYVGAKLAENDIESCIQIGIAEIDGIADARRLFACRRFPGSVFEWTDLMITQHLLGVELLDPFARSLIGHYADFIPLEPEPKGRMLSCLSEQPGRNKQIIAQDIVRALQDSCDGPVHVMHVNGPGRGSLSPAFFWLFAPKLGAQMHVHGSGFRGKENYLILMGFCTAPAFYSKVNAVFRAAAARLGAKFKTFRWPGAR